METDKALLAKPIESDRNCWETPPAVFDYFDKRFGRFTVDGASNGHNSLCDSYYSDAFLATPKGERIWVNPPYRDPKHRISDWIDLAMDWKKRDNEIFMLLLADTGTRWFHRALDCANGIYFVTPRINFIVPKGAIFKGDGNRGASVCLHFHRRRAQKQVIEGIDLSEHIKPVQLVHWDLFEGEGREQLY
jgi:phage N-6-adenine-methyltransferase